MPAGTKRPLAERFKGLPEVSHARPISPADQECIEELYSVLEKHDAENRFGISLLHTHFPVHEDEILVETCDDSTRTMTIKPSPSSEAPETNAVATMWRLQRQGHRVVPLVSCTCVWCTPHGSQAPADQCEDALYDEAKE